MKQPDIDALARLLDGDLPDGEAPAEARALGAFAKALESSAAAPPAFAGKADLRAALVEAAREQAAAPTLLARMRGSISETTTRWRYSMRLAAATGASAMALSGGGVALASQQALPGDALYGVKLALEDAGLLFIGDQAERGAQQLVNAAERMDEAERSAAAGNMDGAARALREADAAGRAGARDVIQASQKRGDPSLLDLLATFSTQQRDRLAALLPLLTGDARLVADDVMVALDRIDQRVAVLGGSCAACGTDTVVTDDARQTAAAPSRDTVLVDARDFDFSDIPPASEPFSPCPCVGVTGTTGGTADKAGGAVDEAEDEATDKPRKPRKPSDPKPDEPKPDEPEPDQGPLPGAPAPVKDTVDKVEDEANDVIDGVLEQLPVDRPTLPPPTTSDGTKVPRVTLPSPDIQLP
jgi:hypothetical protein